MYIYIFIYIYTHLSYQMGTTRKQTTHTVPQRFPTGGLDFTRPTVGTLPDVYNSEAQPASDSRELYMS